MPSRAGGARFTGASASLKAVSGESTRGITDTQTAVPNRKRTDTQRRRFTLHPKWLQITPVSIVCQRCFHAGSKGEFAAGIAGQSPVLFAGYTALKRRSFTGAGSVLTQSILETIRNVSTLLS
jgi:hypothetical protein